MKVLTTGFLIFVAWSAVSTYVYVCKIKDLCKDQVQVIAVAPEKAAPIVEEPASPAPLDSLILHFDFNDTVFIPEKHLQGYAIRAGEYLKANPGKELHITGYTDAIGSEDYNQDLGMRRALDVREYFISRGIDAARITVESDSEEEPVASNQTEGGRQKNRRVKIEIR